MECKSIKYQQYILYNWKDRETYKKKEKKENRKVSKLNYLFSN